MFVYLNWVSNNNTDLFSLVKIKGKTCLSWLYFLVEGPWKNRVSMIGQKMFRPLAARDLKVEKALNMKVSLQDSLWGHREWCHLTWGPNGYQPEPSCILSSQTESKHYRDFFHHHSCSLTYVLGWRTRTGPHPAGHQAITNFVLYF